MRVPFGNGSARQRMHTRRVARRRGPRRRLLRLEPLERRILLDGAALDPHGLFAREVYPADFHSQLHAADFNRDGVPDLFTGTELLTGNGDGSFEPRFETKVGLRFTAAAVGPLGGDGRSCLLCAQDEAWQVVAALVNRCC